MSTDSRRGPSRGQFSALRKILLTTLAGAFAYLLTDLALDASRAWTIVISVFASGVILIVQFLMEFDERLGLLEQKTSDHYTDTQSLVEAGFSRITSTLELTGMVEGSALPSEVVTDFVRHATEIHPEPVPLVYRFAQDEIARVSTFLKALGKGGEVAYDGEDRDWLLALTRNVRSTIRATSLVTADAVGFWMSDLGQLYVELQYEATRRGVAIQHIFILDRAELAQDTDFGRVCEWQLEHDIDVRLLGPNRIPSPWRFAFTLFDEVISYETLPVVRFTPDSPPAVSGTRLVLDQHKVLTRINRFNELWELAAPYERVRGHGADQRAGVEGRFGGDLAAYATSAEPRTTPVRVYLSTDYDHQAVENALEKLLEVYGLEIVQRSPAVHGSWFRHFLARAKDGSPTIEESVAKVVRGIELHTLHRPQAEVDAQQADAVAKLMTALEKEENAAIQIGSILLVKLDNNYVVRTLTQLQLAHLEQNPELFQDPATVLRQLQRAVPDGSRPIAPGEGLCPCGSGAVMELCHPEEESGPSSEMAH